MVWPPCRLRRSEMLPGHAQNPHSPAGKTRFDKAYGAGRHRDRPMDGPVRQFDHSRVRQLLSPQDLPLYHQERPGPGSPCDHHDLLGPASKLLPVPDATGEEASELRWRHVGYIDALMHDGHDRHHTQVNPYQMAAGDTHPGRGDVRQSKLDVPGRHRLQAGDGPARRHMHTHVRVRLRVGGQHRLHETHERRGTHNPHGRARMPGGTGRHERHEACDEQEHPRPHRASSHTPTVAIRGRGYVEPMQACACGRPPQNRDGRKLFGARGTRRHPGRRPRPDARPGRPADGARGS